MRTVISAIHDQGVIGNAQLIQQVEHLTDAVVVIDHHIVIFRLPAPSQAEVLRACMGAEVHMGGVEPHEEGFAGGHRIADETLGFGHELLIGRFHPLLGERTSVLDALAAVAIGPAMQHTAGTVVLAEVGEILWLGVIAQLRLLFRIEVVEVAEKLVKAVHRRQMLIAVTEMVLAELAGAVAERLQQRRDGGVLGAKAQWSPRQPHLAQAGAEHALAADEGGAAGGAALLGVVVNEAATLLSNPVDVGGLVPHQTVAVATEIALADVIAPEDENVGLAVGHGGEHPAGEGTLA